MHALVRRLVATIHFSPFAGKWFTCSSSLTGFIRSEKARFVHSHIHLPITGDASLLHSTHANTFTPFTPILPAGYPILPASVYVPWVRHTAHRVLTPGHRSGDPWPPGRETPPHPGSHRKHLFMFMCLFKGIAKGV